MESNLHKPQLILLDVYETLLDMTEIERHVNQLTDSKRGYLLWFELLMEYTFVDNATSSFHDFSSIAGATLTMTCEMLGCKVNNETVKDVLELMKQLPIKEGVQEGLSQLRDHGFRIAALTNSPEAIVKNRMERTGLISYFEKVFSADQVKKYKPDPIVYQWACKQLELPVDQALLVSVHGWDIAGATNAGLQTAHFRQESRSLYPLARKPQFSCKDLSDLCKQLNELGTT